MHFAYRFKEIIESRRKCASMEVIHKQGTVHKYQISYKNEAKYSTVSEVLKGSESFAERDTNPPQVSFQDRHRYVLQMDGTLSNFGEKKDSSYKQVINLQL